MMAVPIKAVFWGVLLMMLILVVLTAYLFAARRAEDRKRRDAEAYVNRNRTRWYGVLRGMEKADAALIPENDAERTAVEQIFRAYLINVSDSDITGRIRDFAEAHLADFYRRKLRSRDWSSRINALYRIEDFGIRSLIADVRRMDKDRLSPEEDFQVLLIELQFEPEQFWDRMPDRMGELTEYEARQLFYLMPDDLFEETECRLMDLDPGLRYAYIEVLGMRQDLEKLPFLEALLDSGDPETRIRSLRAMDALGIRIPGRILDRAAASSVWEERFIAARMLHRLPPEDAAAYADRLREDPSWLVRQEIRTLKMKGSGRQAVRA